MTFSAHFITGMSVGVELVDACDLHGNIVIIDLLIVSF